ncbi:GNAT family protein [[Empedobacter] haloabium]|uniref:GNAT family protein n=1 Tax=[Empedobacter] haloabium TaxID=592317 RepID=A0ABZ1UQ19_9BURK
MTCFEPFTLPCARLRLRFLDQADAPALYAMFRDVEAMRYWSSSAWTSVAPALAMVEESLAGYASGALLRLGIEVDGTVAGVVTLRKFDLDNRRCEIGYMLARPHWGRGLMQEALPALLDHAFGALNMHRIEADVDPRNTASSRLLQRLGFRHEGRLRERWFVNGEICDSEYYGLLRHEWRDQRREA